MCEANSIVAVLSPVPPKPYLKKIFTPFVMLAAFLYFLLDGLFLSAIRPIFRKLARLRFFAMVVDVIAGLGPYTTLALFLVPLILLEPAKPAGIYLLASGRPLRGIVVIVVGEVLKLAIVERIFHIGRPKLMTIPVFAWAYNFVMGWLNWLVALPAWQAVLHQFQSIMQWTRSLLRFEGSSTPRVWTHMSLLDVLNSMHIGLRG